MQTTLSLLVFPTRANVVSGRHDDQLPLHSLQQIPLAMPQPRRAGRPSPRAQPARPPCSAAAATATRRRPVARRAPGNHGSSHRRAGYTFSLAPRCRKATSSPPARASTPRRTCPTHRNSGESDKEEFPAVAAPDRIVTAAGRNLQR
jgi:hypothetical protein